MTNIDEQEKSVIGCQTIDHYYDDEIAAREAEINLDDPELERAYETNLLKYLQHDLEAFKRGIEEGSSVADCLCCELRASINMAASDGVITRIHAEYLRRKYVRRAWREFRRRHKEENSGNR